MKTALSFDDVLLVPQTSEVMSRKDVDTSTFISKNLTLKIPVISSCMNTVTETHMAISMWKNGGLGIIHRYNTIDEQVKMFVDVKHNNANCAVAIGATGDYLERAAKLIDNGVNIICIDVANGHSKVCIDAIKHIRKTYPNITLVAGNVATGEGAARLVDAGADSIRVGIGSGGACTTRLVSGCGLPTLYSLFDCKEYLDKLGYNNFSLIADGGIKTSGDIVKSLASGAHVVILGQLLAATDESPGEIIEKEGLRYKKYQGMSSFVAQADWRPEKKDEIVPEGETTLLPYKGSVDKILYQLIGGLRSGMSYCGAFNIKQLQEKAKFIQITSAGWTESKPHAKKE